MLLNDVITVAEHSVDGRRQIYFTDNFQAKKNEEFSKNFDQKSISKVSLDDVAAKNCRRVLQRNPHEVVEQGHVGNWFDFGGNFHVVFNLLK